MTGSLPPNYGAWEHLIRIIASFHNWRVRDYFRHERYDEHARDPRIDRPKNNIMQACIIRRNDSAVIVLVRIIFFEISLGNAARLQPILYGLPATNFDEYTLEQRPQVRLFFEEDAPDVPDGFSLVEAEISFRIMDETSETMTETKANSLASKIKAAFGTIPTWQFTKGKYIYSYLDKKNGYWLRIYALSKVEAEDVVRKVLSIQNHTYDADKLKESHAPNKQSDSTPGTRIVYGKTVKRKRYRPQKKVRFRYATLKLDGLDDPIVLYDPYYRLNSPQLAN